jgi:hypothetical protein
MIKRVTGGWYLWRDWKANNWRVIQVTAKNEPHVELASAPFLSPGLLLREDLIEVLKHDPNWGMGMRSSSIPGEPDPQKEAYALLLQLVSSNPATGCYLFYAFSFNHILLQCDCEYDHLSLQQELVHDIFPNLPLGEFTQSFPDLSELAMHLAALPLSDLQMHFMLEKNRAGETVETPIVKLPGRAVTSWGIGVLAILCAYFYIMLRQFRINVETEDKAWDMPWVGISQDIVSKTAFVISLISVFAVQSYLAIKGTQLSIGYLPFIMYLIGVSITAIFIAWTIREWLVLLAVGGRQRTQ